MTSDLSNYHREYSPYGSYALFQFERSDVISVLKNSIEYSFVFFKCLIEIHVKKLQNMVSVISHCASRALSENSARYDVILYLTMF